MLNVAVVFIAFNRPKHTERILEVIKKVKPKNIFLIQDGPRKDVESDIQKCREVRRLLDETIDWDCQINKNYSKNNLGCKNRVVSGLRWVFEHVDRAIILEDDCLPNKDFFVFCEELLSYFDGSGSVFNITGNNFQDGLKRGDGTYYLSKYPHIWGWATWKRALRLYDPDILFWPSWKNSEHFMRSIPNAEERKFWSEKFDSVYSGAIDTWDIQWAACAFYYGWLTATPNVNLVQNIGFGPEATHTKASTERSGVRLESLGPIKHPLNLSRNECADNYVLNNVFLPQNQKLAKYLCIIIAKRILTVIIKIKKLRIGKK